MALLHLLSTLQVIASSSQSQVHRHPPYIDWSHIWQTTSEFIPTDPLSPTEASPEHEPEKDPPQKETDPGTHSGFDLKPGGDPEYRPRGVLDTQSAGGSQIAILVILSVFAITIALFSVWCVLRSRGRLFGTKTPRKDVLYSMERKSDSAIGSSFATTEWEEIAITKVSDPWLLLEHLQYHQKKDALDESYSISYGGLPATTGSPEYTDPSAVLIPQSRIVDQEGDRVELPLMTTVNVLDQTHCDNDDRRDPSFTNMCSRAGYGRTRSNGRLKPRPGAVPTDHAGNSLAVPTDSPLPESKSISPSSFQFGVRFDYWAEGDGSVLSDLPCISPIKDSLRAEVTNSENDLFISTETWNMLYAKAQGLKRRMYADGKSSLAVYARNRPYYNRKFGIAAGEQLSLEHILAIILYSDCTEVQRYFKEQTRRFSREESIDVARKNMKFAIWFRLLYEAVWLFGDELKPGERVYHGIDCELMFEKLEYNFYAPLSTSTSLNAAGAFMKNDEVCSNQGILLELVNGESIGQKYLSMESFSSFPEEREYLFFGPTLKIQNLYRKEPATSQYIHYGALMEMYNFYLNLINGDELSRVPRIKWCCKTTLNVVRKHMRYLEGKADSDDFEKYVERLFLNFTDSPSRIWINVEQLEYLRDSITMKKNANKQLVDLFIHFEDDGGYELGPYLRSLIKSPMTNIEEIGFAKQWDQTASVENWKDIILGSGHWHYRIDHDSNRKVLFSGLLVAGQRGYGQEEMVGFIWKLADCGQSGGSLMVSVQLWCPQIDYYVQFWNVKMSEADDSEDGVRMAGKTALFPRSRVYSLDADQFEWRVIFKVHPKLKRQRTL